MSGRLNKAYAEFLAPYPWQVFLTLTFDRKRMAPSYSVLPHWADKAFRALVLFFNQRLYGMRYRRTTKHKGVFWVRVAEAHRDGVLHFHAVLYSPSGPMPEDLICAAEDWWKSRFGMARAEVPRSRQDVLRYLTKHIGDPERAELDFSWNLRKLE